MLPDIHFPIPNSLRPGIHLLDAMDIPNAPLAPIVLPSFSHIPAPYIRGSDRWPLSLDAQSFPSSQTPVLDDVLI
jgi:hypothetical protein